MNRRTADSVAEAFDGEVIPGDDQPGGEPGWSVLVERKDGRIVVITAKAVDEYYDLEAMARGQLYASIEIV